MTCVECGNESTYWLCSNACAQRHMKAGQRRNCAVCSYDPQTKRVGTLQTNRICLRCRAMPENAEWIRGRKEQPDRIIDRRLEQFQRWRDEQGVPLAELTPRYRRIAQLVLERERVPYAYVDKQGRKRGVRYRWQAYTIRRIAEVEGCSRKEVEEVIASIEK